MSLVNTLKNLKSNLFGKPGSTDFADYPPSKVDGIGMTKTPTSSLDNDPLQFGTYQFPRDVFENGQLGHYMMFYVNVQDQTKYDYSRTPQQIKNLQNQWKINDTLAGTSDYQGTIVDSKGEYSNKREYIANRALKNAGGNLSKTGIDLSVGPGNRNSKTLQGVSSFRKTTTRIKDSIALYLPANVTDTTSATYEGMPTGLLGKAAGDLIRFGGALQRKDFEAAGNISALAVGDILQEGVKRLGGAAAEALSGGEGAVPLANKLCGRADNPFIEVLFQTMNLRTFTYNFNFAPRNEAETMEIQQIIQLFRFHMAPELQGVNGRYYTLPSTFDIHYMYKAEDGAGYENDFYTRLSTCVLEGVDTNYTPGDKVRSFADGAPTQITMSLKFTETEVLTKEKINKGY